MVRERTLRIVLVIVGLLFVAGVYPLVMFFSREPTVPMLMSIYVTLGIFLLLAARNPVESRNLIAAIDQDDLVVQQIGDGLLVTQLVSLVPHLFEGDNFCLDGASESCASMFPHRMANHRATTFMNLCSETSPGQEMPLSAA